MPINISMIVLYTEDDGLPWSAEKIRDTNVFKGWSARSFVTEFTEWETVTRDQQHDVLVTEHFRLRKIGGHIERGFYVVYFNNCLLARNLLPLATIDQSIIDLTNAGKTTLLLVLWHEPFLFRNEMKNYAAEWQETLYYTLFYLGIKRPNSVRIVTNVMDLELSESLEGIATIGHYDFFETHYRTKLLNNNKIKTPNEQQGSKLFLCLNKVPRTHRYHLWHALNKMDLLKDGLVSMWPDDKWKELANNDQGESLLQSYIQGLDDKNIVPRVLDHADPAEEYTFEDWIYRDTDVSLISETCFYDDQMFMTEKTYKAIANFHPFVMVGPKGSLAYLRSRGYRTFSDFWDESYDDMDNTPNKLMVIAKLMLNLNFIKTYDNARWVKMLEGTREIVIHNEQLFMKNNYEQMLHDCLIQGL